MKTNISIRMLRHITHEISNGNAVWALLTANEYLAANDPLRKILLKKVTNFGSLQDSFRDGVLAGKRLADFTDDEQLILRAQNAERKSVFKKQVPVIVPYQFKRINSARHVRRLGDRS